MEIHRNSYSIWKLLRGCLVMFFGPLFRFFLKIEAMEASLVRLSSKTSFKKLIFLEQQIDVSLLEN